MLTLILVRHGERLSGGNGVADKDTQLTDRAKAEAEALGRRIGEIWGQPDAIIASTYRHSLQTAFRLAEGFENAGGVLPSRALTPASRPGGHWADDILYAEIRRLTGQEQSRLLLVGHETRLSQLVVRFTSTRVRSLDALEAICIEARSLGDLWLGLGRIAWRYPVRNWLEAELADKLQSKMTVATFLASANFIGLIEILVGFRGMLGNETAAWPSACRSGLADYCGVLLLFRPPWHLIWLAFTFQFAAAGLFIASVFLFDRLAMPGGFWKLRPPTWRNRLGSDAREKLRLDGYPYAYMIRVWTNVFTPAVALSVVGVLLLVAATGVGLLLAASLAIAAVVMSWYVRLTPTGEID